MTQEQILKCSDEDLPTLAGEVLHAKPWKHCFNNNTCVTCGQGRLPSQHDESCLCTDPIPLTWDNAMKWRDWAVEKFGYAVYRKAMVSVYYNSVDFRDCSFDEFMLYKTKPKHYIKVAMLCKVNQKGNNNE